MAYTASALSFMFENLGKTVIVTGSQVTEKCNRLQLWTYRMLDHILVNIHTNCS